jgi:oligopeptide transport system substrate-binding protein
VNKLVIIPLFLIIVLAAGVFGDDVQDDAEERDLVLAFYPTDIDFNPIHTYTSTEAQLYTAIYEGLVQYHPLSLEPVPAVARYWEISPDGKTYTFYLREDALYWNGEQVTAEHFKKTWLKMLDPEEKAEYSFLFDIIDGAKKFRLGLSDDPDGVGITAVSDSVLKVTLEQPAAHFLKILCHHSFVPIHPDFLEIGDWKELTSIPGNGPYYVVNYSPEEIQMLRNELYWDRKNVSIPMIHVRFIEDPDGVTEAFNRDEIQWVSEGMSINTVANENTIMVNPLFATNYFYFSANRPPWTDERIRRALALLLPWEEIRSTDFQFIPADTLVPPIPYYPEIGNITTADKKEALTLLTDAGYPGGNGLPEIVIMIPAGLDSERIAGIMKQTWQDEIGLEAKIKPVEYPDYFKSLKQSDYALATLTWIGDFADPLTFLQMWISDSNLNDSGYQNEEYDNLITQSMDMKGNERYETLGQAEAVLLENAVVLPISHTPAINLIDLERIDGWFPNPLDIHPFKYLKYAEPSLPPGVVLKPDFLYTLPHG